MPFFLGDVFLSPRLAPRTVSEMVEAFFFCLGDSAPFGAAITSLGLGLGTPHPSMEGLSSFLNQSYGNPSFPVLWPLITSPKLFLPERGRVIDVPPLFLIGSALSPPRGRLFSDSPPTQ